MECLICGSASVKAIGKRSDFCILDGYGEFVDSLEAFDRDLVRCEACGLAFINPMYDSADFAQLYGPRYDAFAEEAEHKDSSAEAMTHSLGHLSSLGIPEWQETFKTRRGRRPRMLDIGCGYGRLLSIFDKMGFEVNGIEIHKAAVEHVRSTLGFSVEEVDLFDYSTLDRYDLITLWHVIEHFPDPSAAIDKVLNILSPEGLLVLETPWADDSGHYDDRYRDIYHTLFFNHLSLFLLGVKHGLAVRRSQRFSYFAPNAYHKYVQIVYSPSVYKEIAASHVQSLGALFNNMELEHSNTINALQDARSSLSKAQETIRALQNLPV